MSNTSQFPFNQIVKTLIFSGFPAISHLFSITPILSHSFDNYSGKLQKICRKSDLSFLIGCFLLDEGIFLKQHISVYIFDIFTGIKAEDAACKNTVCIFFFLQNSNLYFLTGILPFFIISDYRCVLITVGKINISRFSIQ